MIFYFSGTGNTKWVAQRLANLLEEEAISIADELENTPAESVAASFHLADGERVGFAFPVHSWGPPPIVLEFIAKLNLKVSKDTYLYFVCTHGDDAGYTRQITHKALADNNYHLSSAFSITMPNNYVCFPGFDVDDAHLRNNKLCEAEITLKQIGKFITQRVPALFEINVGGAAWLKSRVIYPLFVKYGLSDKPFHATDECTLCGKCKRGCPTNNITLESGKPKWLGKCTQCLACYHVCPTHSIQYGRITQKKGQYWHDKYVSNE